MPEIRWSQRAKAKLENFAPAIRDQLTSDAGKILHYIPPVLFPHDEGFAGEIMWHRGIACGMLAEDLLEQEDDNDGPWNYFLLYTARRPEPEEPDPDRSFQVLDIRSIADISRRWNE
jgi:hypothetical protein